jgi:hypothetical protein
LSAFQKVGRGFLAAAAGSLVLVLLGVLADVWVLTMVGAVLAGTFLVLGVVFLVVQARLFGNPADNARLLAEGLPVSATLNSAQGTSGRVGADPIMKLDLTVNMVSVLLRTVVPVQHAHRLQPGATIPVKVDPDDATRCAVDWGSLAAAR